MRVYNGCFRKKDPQFFFITAWHFVVNRKLLLEGETCVAYASFYFYAHRISMNLFFLFLYVNTINSFVEGKKILLRKSVNYRNERLWLCICKVAFILDDFLLKAFRKFIKVEVGTL